MKDDKDYEAAWVEAEEKQEDKTGNEAEGEPNPITKSVKAAAAAAESVFADAFDNDNYGIDVVAAANKDSA